MKICVTGKINLRWVQNIGSYILRLTDYCSILTKKLLPKFHLTMLPVLNPAEKKLWIAYNG